ncbi:LLM class F420-dependent oxidoreductase [Amycolatopsis pithecellobii]|uniref:TIGR03619 family F420-dependent LLM class oxidoreductase n=1 Tax=Amycolatopsis pithecellobii TaxID=664692 RepID=A0A6N7Z5K1_9PSEU|nr:LLM class F420-dependent oxidoreductase [Amycolatopsis pithecellobii]MTD57583.1 TIGR03619 family F420-dependent LLM class oxidoreductase [Amycolatopsis pithecellobii]
MKIGALLPHDEVGAHPGDLRDFVQTVEGLGYDHILQYEHVLGAGRGTRPDWTGPYDADNLFHEPFVLFGYLAGVTISIEFVTGVFILPQRQTALVAKQAAEVALLSGNRLRLGVGLGWNKVEYESLGVPWSRRAARYEEQISVLRALWGEHTTTVDGEFHTIIDAGINPRPTEPVPLWLGSGPAEPAIDRVARLADGWIPGGTFTAELGPQIERVRSLVESHGRDPAAFGIQARLVTSRMPAEQWGQECREWAKLGVSHLAVSSKGIGNETLSDHLRFLEKFKAENLDPVR